LLGPAPEGCGRIVSTWERGNCLANARRLKGSGASWTVSLEVLAGMSNGVRAPETLHRAADVLGGGNQVPVCPHLRHDSRTRIGRVLLRDVANR
jgi:hypothetical protein